MFLKYLKPNFAANEKCFDCENKIQIKEMGALCQCTVVRPNVFKLLESRQCEHYKEQEVEERLK